MLIISKIVTIKPIDTTSLSCIMEGGNHFREVYNEVLSTVVCPFVSIHQRRVRRQRERSEECCSGEPASDDVVDYGNGVYYFNFNKASFGNALSKFLSENPCRVEAVAGDGTGGYGRDMGYFVVCR